MPVFLNRPADAAAELIKVIRRLRAVLDLVDHIIRIERLVSIELEYRTVEFVGAGLGHHVDHGSTGPAILGGIAVGVDLKFFHRILAELKGSTAGSRSSGRLAEEGVVVVGAI